MMGTLPPLTFEKGGYNGDRATCLKRLRTPGLESDSTRNNIHPNNKRKPEIQTKTPEK